MSAIVARGETPPNPCSHHGDWEADRWRPAPSHPVWDGCCHLDPIHKWWIKRNNVSKLTLGVWFLCLMRNCAHTIRRGLCKKLIRSDNIIKLLYGIALTVTICSWRYILCRNEVGFQKSRFFSFFIVPSTAYGQYFLVLESTRTYRQDPALLICLCSRVTLLPEFL